MEGKKPYLDEAAALRLYQMHLYDRDIAGRLGVSAATVGAWRRREGLPSWRDVDRAENRLAAQRADRVQEAQRGARGRYLPQETLEEAANHATDLGMSYGQYMEAKRTGKILV